MKCPSCGVDASGNFCMACGHALKVEKCSSCGETTSPGARFCTGCGRPLKSGKGAKTSEAGTTRSGPPASKNPNLAWWVAGALLVVVLFSLGYPVLSRGTRSGGGVQSPGSMGGETGGQGLVDLTTISLEEQGTILFNRVMTSNSNGDTADVEFFLPKALFVYGELEPTDPDGLYHFALLHQVGGDHEAALEKARAGLTETPDYLLLLAVAAQASVALGDDSTARELYGRLLEVYDAEMALMRPGYEHHQAILPAYREEARTFLNRG